MPVRSATPTGRQFPGDGNHDNGDASEIDPNDPRVKKLVYSMYRDMLTSYNPQANKIIGEKDPRNVVIDHGIAPILECIIRGGGSSAAGGGGGGEVSEGGDAPPAPPPPSLTGGSVGERGPPPPPPMAPPGAMPSMRLNSEIGPRDKGPPAALGSAMMKDKKPFTYTPGGIDLSEIRSPRMAKRLAMNAQAEGVTSVPSIAANHPSHSLPPHVLSPAALAQMQPQIAIPVFPQGPMQQRTPKHTTDNSAPAPPPPPPPSNSSSLAPQRPKTPVERPKTPVSLNSALNEAFAAQRGARVAQNAAMAVALQAQRDAESNPNTPPVTQVNEGQQSHPLQGYTVTQARPQPQQTQPTPTIVTPPIQKSPVPQPPQQMSPQEVTRRSVSPPGSNVGQGSIYVPPLSPPQNTNNARPLSPARQKAAALGSIYIPPVEQQQQQAAPQRSVNLQQQQQQMRSPPPPPQATPPTPTQLNKAPTPWMNSYNKMVKQAESPPYVNPGNVVTPWGVMTPGPSGGGGGMSSPPPPQMAGGGGNVRTIPISIQRDFSEPNTPMSPSVFVGGGVPQGDNKATAAQHLGRVIPIQIQRQQSQTESVQQSGARNIPIQIEGRQGTAAGGRRVAGPPTLSYNNPPGGNYGPPQELMGGMQNMSMGGPRMEPAQSKAMRVIQQAAENDVDNFWGQELRKWESTENPYRRMESMDNDNSLTFVVNHQVDMTEPRFRGGTIPSRAFKTLLSSLPPPTTTDAESSYPGSQPPQHPQQQQQHMIQIRMTPMSPTPSGGGGSAAASEARTPEPRKYMGASIPSRSFKILQAMTNDADPDAGDAASSEVGVEGGGGGGGGLSCSSSSSSCSSSDPSSSSPMTFDPSSYLDPASFVDPYSSYMSWYYWWYYLSCYWAGYDMTGIEMPEGWDPENPYWPPEWSTEEVPSDGNESDVPSDVEKDALREEVRSLSDCDKRGGATTEEEESYWSCDDEHIKKEEEEEEEEEETEGEDEDGEVVGVVEEPETPLSSAEDSDAPTLVDGWDEEPRQKGGVFIEEVDGYSSTSLSTNSSDAELLGGGGLRRLSTIDEVSTRSSWSGATTNSGGLIGDDRLRRELEELGGGGGDGGEEDDEESSEEESVIENKSGAALSESKREEWTTSSSSESEEEEEEEEEKEEEAVTFRLPLKLSFSKTKSYKDITTVLVGEVDDGEELKKEEEQKKEEPMEEDQDEEEEEEPVVSFTISLSRQASKEEEPEVDFWGQIIGKEEGPAKEKKEDQRREDFEPVVDFWGNACEEEEQGKEEAEPVVVVLRKKPPLQRRGGDKQRPCSVGGVAKNSFNFWDKEVKSFETRRFSGNFEISEDYESDSGMKSDTGGSGEQRKRIKKFTRTAGQKRHSIPLGLPISLRSFGRREEEEEELEDAEVEVKVVEPETEEPEVEEVNGHEEIQPPVGVVKSETTDLSAGWSYWDDLENAGSKPTSPSLQVENVEAEELEPEESQPKVEEPEEQEPEIEQPEDEDEYEEEAYEVEGEVEVTVDLRLPAPKPTSSFSEISGQSEEFSDCAEGDEENEESEDEDYEEEPQPQEVPQQPHFTESLKTPEPPAPLSQQSSTVDKHDDPQSSEESSSKSSGRTILPEPRTSTFNVKKPILEERPIEIQTISEAIKLEDKEESPPKCTADASFCASNGSNLQGASSNCTCHIGDRMARAESLLWRIERFLHESLSLGSEDDSGVMTDLSRQISDVDTDNDQPEGDISTGGLLLATKDFMRTSSPLVTRQKPRPKSEIICVESLANDITEELAKKSAPTSDVTPSNVKMRGTAAERKALRYQRAKTHSRLFQLLQDECGKEEDEEEDDEDPEEFLDCVETTSIAETSRINLKTPVNSLDVQLPSVTTPIQVETSNEPTSSTSERKSRLMPLPLRNTCGDGDSNSSASGSSGVLSPTSPVTRDQLLADIITEFHLRHQQTFPKTRRIRSEKFPSRIFKLLQSEFGEEFYETFDTLGTELRWLRGEEEEEIAKLKSPLFKEKGEELLKECTIHKSESLKALEDAEQAKKTKSPDLLEVPLRRKLKGGSTVTRDFRSPKRK